MLTKAWAFITHDITRDQMNAVMRVGWRALLLFHIAFACGWLGFIGLSGFAKAEEAGSLKSTVAKVAQDLQRWQDEQRIKDLEREISRLDQEIFAIEARLAEIGRLGQQADALYNQRLASLRTEKARVERQLEVAMRNIRRAESGG